ncbi:MAG: hypothetical protein IH586_09185 [Anaerolineaceae bacterium]|nr:hypothetical protein [Anaerolineaceae bacterium]
MKYTYGTIIAVAAALLFYLRLIILQRQKVKQHALAGKAERRKKRSPSGKDTNAAGFTTTFPKLEISFPFLLGLGILLILFGAVLSVAPWFIPQVRDLWWIPVTVGIILMSITIH